MRYNLAIEPSHNLRITTSETLDERTDKASSIL
jgi:hypothetical protein